LVAVAISGDTPDANTDGEYGSWTAGWTEIKDRTCNAGNGGAYAFAYKTQTPAGASGTVSVTTVTSSEGGAVTWSICP
jgi:hypothetical protein